MDLRAILLATLASPALAGCSSVWNCHPDEEDFELDATLTVAELEQIGLDPGEAPTDVDCARACGLAYERDRGWFETDVEDCALAVDEAAFVEGAAPDAVAAEVSCAGHGIEYYCEGRRPLGHVEVTGSGADPVGRALAELAHLEAASVVAFQQLAGWLGARGAPAALVARCHAAAEDEVRHARWLGALAAARGGSAPPPRQGDVVADDLAVALHNAVEGCVYETWAALEAAVAARRTRDPALRTVWARIAADEAGHAQLAWDLHAWLLARLPEDQQQQVRAAQRRALDALATRAATAARTAPPPLGLPSPAAAGILARDLAARLAA